MKTLTNLQFTLTDEQIIEPRGIISGVHEEPMPGFHRVIQLGSAGLFIRRGQHVVCIPRAALLQAAEQAEPELVPRDATPPHPDMQALALKSMPEKIREKIAAAARGTVTLLLLISTFCFPNFCFGQLVFPKTTLLSGYTNLLAGSNYAPNTEILFYRDRGFALIATAVGTNTSEVGPIKLSFQVSGDRTNYTTTAPLTWTFALTGTNYVRAYTNFPAAVADNIRSAILAGTTNLGGPSATTVRITNIISYIVP